MNLIKKFIFYLTLKLFKKSNISFFSNCINCNFIYVGDKVSIGVDTVLFPIRNYGCDNFDSSITIGDSVYIGHHSQVHCIGKLTIGRGSVISDYAYISDVAHGLSPIKGLIMEQSLISKGSVSIGENCFIGYGAFILPGVRLGDYCIVSAGAVVTKSFSSYSMIAGNPAKLIKTFDVESNIWKSV